LAEVGHANHDSAVTSDGGDSGVDVGSFVSGEVVEAGVDSCDESADTGDFFFRRYGFGSCQS